MLGVSDDTVRRWVSAGRLEMGEDDSGCSVVPGEQLARLAQELANGSIEELDPGLGRRSARNHLTGIVTAVKSDPVMSQVELQCGRFRVVSLISTEAVEELGLQVGAIGTAVIKATNVTIEAGEA